jgi:hypothetical protein
VFQQGFHPKPGVIQNSLQGMRSEKSYYVIDGMHRLIAYGLWADLNANHFPISIYLCTDNKFFEAES